MFAIDLPSQLVTVDVLPDWISIVSLIVSAVAAIGTVFAVLVAVSVSRRDTHERKRLPASRVTGWPGLMDPRITSPTPETIIISNGSNGAIYDVVVGYGSAWGTQVPEDTLAYPGWLTSVPPGTWFLEGPANPGNALDFRAGIFLEFTDAAGNRWHRSARGVLTPITNDRLDRMQRESKPDNRGILFLAP
ncbi:hypothetical protein ACPPVQ_05930 [Diaminobutyricibacter sp. McL0618]|uniref:hypothetical protein n=1 Tax=Leifsonia sp. McL0618 TaxID=3415677 RepID=UPI003CE73785